MIKVDQAFQPSYRLARKAFLEAASMHGLPSFSYNLDLPGQEGEQLAMDVVRDGPADADRILMVSSGCHGVEGFCGSGVQVYALHDEAWRNRARAAGVTVLYVHALNPHGFSFARRVTHENVDLNRNFVDFSRPLPHNPYYRELDPLLLPAQWPPGPDSQAAMQAYMQTHGIDGLQNAVTPGQYEIPDGLFFGGQAPTWSNRTVRQLLREHVSHARQLAWIDVHTGLGANGVGERILSTRDDALAYQRAQAWWNMGDDVKVTSIYDGSSTSARLDGLMCLSVYDECPETEYTGIALEFGTVPMTQVMDALRADHWCHRYASEATPAQVNAARAQAMAAFFDESLAWKGQIIAQSRQVLHQAVDGLSASH
ncbi:M14 family metallopeptidase [Hydrogenophaga sp. 5NK40-0174]|uniref:M14 family metallopeptidase n=1 Tax=Hydrogenophaga sp. 5NK40-0174 TaxID=3127649 RepID=UPI003109BDB3